MKILLIFSLLFFYLKGHTQNNVVLKQTSRDESTSHLVQREINTTQIDSSQNEVLRTLYHKKEEATLRSNIKSNKRKEKKETIIQTK